MTTIKAKIVFLMGPTAAGKTQLAVDLVKHFPFEIISVDSAMIYRGMDIGTAKPSATILKMAPHRLIDILDPAESYSAAQFRDDAVREINDILQRGKIPLLVGGTMLYFSTLQKGLSELPSADPEIRAAITQEANEIGWAALHERLASIDSAAGKRIHPNDTQRIQRALEVFMMTGKSLSDWQESGNIDLPQYEIFNLAVAPSDRAVLHERIEMRFREMLREGFLEEVKKLFSRGDLTLQMPSIRSVGYRQAWEYLLGNLTFEEFQERGVIATRQLAKRQLTWLRSWPEEIMWLESLDENKFEKACEFLRVLLRSPE
jgi:tRNA dimethylallyltransferase